MSNRELKLDLHPIYNRGDQVDAAVMARLLEAEEMGAKSLTIICGKGSGALRKRVLRLLNTRRVRAMVHRVERPAQNHGQVIVHFRW